MRRYPLDTLLDPSYPPETLDPDVSSVGSYIGFAATVICIALALVALA